jgi:hypothetical protein
VPGSSVVLSDFENEEDFALIKKEDFEEGDDLEKHREVAQLIGEMVQEKSAGKIRVTSRIINTSAYFRWLARTKKRNTSEARAEFLTAEGA